MKLWEIRLYGVFGSLAIIVIGVTNALSYFTDNNDVRGVISALCTIMWICIMISFARLKGVTK